MRNLISHLAVVFVATLIATTTPCVAQATCSGTCAQQISQVQESGLTIRYVPGISEAPNGSCYQDCTWTSCRFQGHIEVTNNTGAVRVIKDHNGNEVGMVVSGTTLFGVDVKPGCGAAQGAAWMAFTQDVDGQPGVFKASFTMSCEACAQSGN